MARLLIMLVLAFAGCNGHQPGYERVRVGNRDYLLELAVGEVAITRGMMGYTSIPDGTGMLFIFPEPTVRQFWMGDCLIDIDVIFLDSRGRITAMHEMIAETPRGDTESDFAYRQRMPQYSSGYPVRFAIELPEGSINETGVAPGDAVELDLDRLKRLARN